MRTFATLKIRTQVLLCVGMVALVTVAVIFAVSVGMFASVGAQSKAIVSSSLQDQALQYLLAASSGSADEIGKKLQTMEGIVSMLGTALTDLFGDPGYTPFHPVPSYFWWNYSTLPSDVTYQARWKTEVSYCCSAYYYPHSTFDTLPEILNNTQLNYTISRSAHMDTLFPQITAHNVEIAQIEIGFASTLLRRYPAINAFRSRDYDPTLRPWYKAAFGQTGLSYTDPYQNSITFEWTIAIAQSIFDEEGYLGVLAIEMRTNLIEQSILSQQLYNTGYALLIQTDGLVVAGRVWDSETSNNTVNLDSFSNLYSAIQPLGVAQARPLVVDGKDVFVSQSVIIRNRYVVVHIVPRDEVLNTLYVISAKEDTSFDRVLGVTAAVGVGTLFVVFFLSTFLAAKVTKPIVVVSEVAVKIALNAVKDNLMDNIEFQREFNSQDEVGDLARAFKRMINQLSGRAPKNTEVNVDVPDGVEMKNIKKQSPQEKQQNYKITLKSAQENNNIPNNSSYY